jgi:hypothetical protein
VVSTHEDVPSKAEAGSLDDLIADGAVVQRLLDLRHTSPLVPDQRSVSIPESMPESALAVVAGLDSYGD